MILSGEKTCGTLEVTSSVVPSNSRCRTPSWTRRAPRASTQSSPGCACRWGGCRPTGDPAVRCSVSTSGDRPAIADSTTSLQMRRLRASSSISAWYSAWNSTRLSGSGALAGWKVVGCTSTTCSKGPAVAWAFASTRYRTGPHCMNTIGWWPSLRAIVADSPMTNCALAWRTTCSKLWADRW